MNLACESLLSFYVRVRGRAWMSVCECDELSKPFPYLTPANKKKHPQE